MCFFRPNYDVKFSGNLPPVFRCISKPHVTEPAVPDSCQLHQAHPHPPRPSSKFRLQCLHPGATRHDLCQPGKASAS